MSYYTYFEGELSIHLEEPALGKLRTYIDEDFKDKSIFSITGDSLIVDGEWKDHCAMEYIVLFIKENGILNSGSINCYGEDEEDVWEIFISENKPFIREHGTVLTLYRTKSKIPTVNPL